MRRQNATAAHPARIAPTPQPAGPFARRRCHVVDLLVRGETAAHHVRPMKSTCIGIRITSGVAGSPRSVTPALAAWMLAGKTAMKKTISAIPPRS